MAKIANLNDLKNITSNITSFSHAYLFNVNSLDLAYPYIKEFAKSIILQGIKDEKSPEFQDISYKIDNDEFDDLYVVNPDTISINTIEINKLLQYMQTKSIRDNGKRVYIIYGFERLSRDVSNKILKFLEEPAENIYALLLTENVDKILSTIISRCQVINLTFEEKKENIEVIEKAKLFISELIDKKNKMIAYEYKYLKDELTDRLAFYEIFNQIEVIINENIKYKYEKNCCDMFHMSIFDEIEIRPLINILKITNELKSLIKGNINLNLLLDRYIIEVTEVLNICKK